jgi:ParB/RepB/Spo0J family partition protein
MATATKKPPAKKAPVRKAAAAKKTPAKRPAPKPSTRPPVQQVLVEWVSLDDIVPNPDNIRQDLGDLTDLAASIAELGVLQPGIGYRLESDPTKVMLLAGHRRHGASAIAGRDEMPMIIRAQPDRVEQLEIMISENNDRAELDPIELGLALAELKRSGLRSVKAIAQKAHRSETWTRNHIALVEKLPEVMWDAVRSGELSVTDATAIATAKGLTDKERQSLADEPDEWSRKRKTNELTKKAKIRVLKDRLRNALPERTIHVDTNAWGPPKTGAKFEPVRYGDKPGQITTPPPMGNPEHQYIRIVSETKYEVWHTAPELLDAADFASFPTPAATDGELVNEVHLLAPTDPLLVDAVRAVDAPGCWGSYWADRAHPFCAFHALVDAPWGSQPLAVCLRPSDHADGGPVSWRELQERHGKATAAAKGSPAEPVAPVRQLPQYDEIFSRQQTEVISDALEEALKAIPVGLLVALFNVTACPTVTMTDDGPTLDAGDFDGLCDDVTDEIIRALTSGAGIEPGQTGEDAPVLYWLCTTLRSADLPLPDGLAQALGEPPGPIDDFADLDDEQEEA